jgi:nitrate/nitrite-specific signal transduction histidine kinase
MDATGLSAPEAVKPGRVGGHPASIPSRIDRGLRFKLIFFIVGVSLVSVLASTFLLITLQRKQLVDNARAETTTLSSIVESSLQHAMLAENKEMVEEIIWAIAASPTINKIRILDAQGTVSATSDAQEIGSHFEKTDQACTFCHTGENTPENQTIVSESIQGQPILYNVNLLQNKAPCHGCHDPAQQVLGLLMIETPLTAVQDQSNTSFWWTISIAAATIGLLICLLIPALRRFIIEPIEELGKGLSEISAGNLDYHVRVSSQDELGILARSFDVMRTRLKALLEDMDRRNKELTVLNEVALTVNQSLDLQHVLDEALETVTSKLGIESGLIFLHNEKKGRFELRASKGTPDYLCQEIEYRRQHHSWDISGQVAEYNQPYFVANMSQDERFEGLWDDLQNRSYINVPLGSKGKVVGTLALVSYAGKPFEEKAISVFEAVGNEIGIAIENANLYLQLRYLAGLEERERLARELHDHVAQALGYLNVKASITDDLLTGGQIGEARESLLELKKVAKIVYNDIRESIFNLRAAASSRTDLLSALREYLDEYRKHYGLSARLLVDEPELYVFSPEVASQLLRIIQEAMTNVRKHAGANNLWIVFNQDYDVLSITIQDDGRGFSPTQLAKDNQQHFGLQIMRERAQSIGGSLELDSQPGQGTQIVIRLPSAKLTGIVV